MHQQNIDIVGLKFTPVAVNVTPHAFRVSRVGLGQHRNLFARQPLERPRDSRMRPIGVRGIKKPQAAFVSVDQKVRQALHPKTRLM
jgi:hypothetical protein